MQYFVLNELLAVSCFYFPPVRNIQWCCCCSQTVCAAVTSCAWAQRCSVHRRWALTLQRRLWGHAKMISLTISLLCPFPFFTSHSLPKPHEEPKRVWPYMAAFRETQGRVLLEINLFFFFFLLVVYLIFKIRCFCSLFAVLFFSC